MHRDADGAGLIGDGAGDGLANPPGGVGRELVAAAVLELVDRLHEADVALLNEVEELQAAVGVLLRDGDDEAQVGFDQLALGLLGVHVALDHFALGALELADGDAGVGFDFLEIDLAVFLLAAVLLLELLALGGFVLLVERADLALERAHGVDGLVDLVEQALALHGRVLELADDAGDVDLFAGDDPAEAAGFLDLGLGGGGGGGDRFSSSAAIFFWCLTRVSMRATVALTRACTTSSVSSSSSKMTTSFTLRTPRLRSSPRAAISRMTMGEREMALSTRIWPRSMRLAISTSPSRVSSGTVPISRRYMRTGSLVFSSVPGVRSSSTSSPSSELEILVAGELGGVEQIDALGADGGDQIVEIVGRGDLIGQHVVDVAVGEIALLFAHFDDVVNVVFEFVVNRQNSPSLSGAMDNRLDAPSLRDGARVRCARAREKRFPSGNLWHACGRRFAVTRKKEAVSGSCSEQDDSASGFAWLAREPQLMCGAKGRASSQRSIDYHSPPQSL